MFDVHRLQVLHGILQDYSTFLSSERLECELEKRREVKLHWVATRQASRVTGPKFEGSRRAYHQLQKLREEKRLKEAAHRVAAAEEKTEVFLRAAGVELEKRREVKLHWVATRQGSRLTGPKFEGSRRAYHQLQKLCEEKRLKEAAHTVAAAEEKRCS
ncbi:uncharacterized protein LOC144877756 [Branchiostoma floridae x Branchiostoma japonicum]